MKLTNVAGLKHCCSASLMNQTQEITFRNLNDSLALLTWSNVHCVRKVKTNNLTQVMQTLFVSQKQATCQVYVIILLKLVQQ